jgi:protoheme IX farnesyltransferase
MVIATSAVHTLKVHYWPLIKSRQTLMLTLTGLAGYLCQPASPPDLFRFASLAGSLLMTISGCTVLNMLLDRDIDRQMTRTHTRPLAAGQVNPQTALFLGTALVSVGLLWSATLSTLYFTVILAGAGLNVLVYTLWLKRLSAWSILLGGIAGGMPILAGRTLAIGRIDPIGILLALAVVHWIPSHNLTLATIYTDDYRKAGVPTIPSVYGAAVTHFIVTFSSVMVALFMMFVHAQLHLAGLILAVQYLSGIGLVSLSVYIWINPSQKLISILYKYSSLYMLVSMLSLSLSRMG